MFKPIALALILTSACFAGFPNSYYEIKDIKAKKQAFMDIILPLAHEAQHKIKNERLFIQYAFYLKKKGWKSSELDTKIAKLAKKYRIKNPETIDPFLKKIHIIPDALVLAQAAAESGWGNSYFVKKANNIFGEWTWGEKGIIPKQRPVGKKYKIRIFDSLQDSVDSYMLNLNRHYAYEDLRTARKRSFDQGRCFKGKEATKWLKNYSGIGHDYEVLLQDLINYNKMCEYSMLFGKK